MLTNNGECYPRNSILVALAWEGSLAQDTKTQRFGGQCGETEMGLWVELGLTS